MDIEVCADAIATYEGNLVLVERLSEPRGLSLAGGRLEPGESLELCVVREFFEETGFELSLDYQFGTYSHPARDPRGQKVSTVYVGEASGQYRDEPGKTQVVLMDPSDVGQYRDRFAFDHYRILQEYLQGR